MAYTITFLESEQCILVRHDGEVTEAEIRAGMAEIFRMAGKSAVRRLLIDWRAASRVPSGGELWHVMQSEIGQVRLRRELRRAIVARPDQRWTADLFAELAANHGFSFRVFEAESEALRWLSQSLDRENGNP